MWTRDQQNRGSEASYWDTIQGRQLGTVPSCGGEHPPGVTPGQSVCSVVSANSALTSPQPASPNDQVYSCDQCGHKANVTVDLKKHKAEVHKNSAYTCDQCKYMANKTEYQKKHTEYEHKDSKYYCEQCELENSRTEDLKHHIETQYKAGSWEQYPPVEGSIPQALPQVSLYAVW